MASQVYKDWMMEGVEGYEIVVKHTFLDFSDPGTLALRKKRSISEPPRLIPASSTEQDGLVWKVGGNCIDSCRGFRSSLTTEGTHIFLRDADKVNAIKKHVAVENVAWPGNGSMQGLSEEAGKLVPHQRQTKEKRATGSCDWWRSSQYNCPLCDFPIRLLPCPPFKLPRGDGSKVLVDGQFLAAKILTSWDFKVLGRMLTHEDIQALDAHMKIRKLGGPRIGDAIALMASGSPEAHAKLAQMRAAAQDKFELLMKTKDTRLSRLAFDHCPSISTRHYQQRSQCNH